MRFLGFILFAWFAGLLLNLPGQKLHLAHASFESQSLQDVALPEGQAVYVWIHPGKNREISLPVLGHYGNGWFLLNWQEMYRSYFQELGARVVVLSSEERLHTRDPDASVWWVWSPVHFLTPSAFLPLSQTGWYRFQGNSAQLKEWAHLPFIWAEPASGKPQPDTLAGGRVTQTKGMWESGLPFSGRGVGIQVNEDGDLQSHVDFSGRLNEVGLNITAPTQDHGDHVAGIAAGGGIRDPQKVGVAPQAMLWNQWYTTDPTLRSGLYIADSLFQHHGVRVSNTSYSDGCNTGYTAWSRWVDEQVNAHSGLVHVFSAGNAGATQCGYGAGLGFGTITGGHKQAKNTLVVGNISVSGTLAGNSSRGPATDGRLKPDLVAPGVQIPSTSAFLAQHGYQVKSGTSMSAPMVAGLAAALMDAYKTQIGTFPSAALTRALLMNTAEDLGAPGPDFSFGYGRPRPFEALATLQDGTFMEDTLFPTAHRTYAITVPTGVQELRVMLHYDDVAAGPGALQTLIQDADLQLISPSGAVVLPWVCSPLPGTVNLPAQRTQDRVNSTEQVTIAAPEPGQWTIEVRPHSLPAGPLPFALVYRMFGLSAKLWFPDSGACLLAGDSLEMIWHTGSAVSSFQPEWSLNNGQTWQPLGPMVPATKGKATVALPSQILSEQVLFRLQPSASLTSRGTSVVAPRPENLQVDSVCGPQAWLSWQPVAGAQAYQLWRLQGSRMVPWGVPVTGNQTMVTPWNESPSVWWAVSVAFPNGGLGPRSLAVSALDSSVQCGFWQDYALLPSVFPVAGQWHYLMDSVALPTKRTGWVVVENRGKSQGEQGRLQSNRGLDTLIQLPNPGEMDTLAFYDFLYIDTSATPYTIWLSTPTDQVNGNDSLVFPGIPGTRTWIGEAWPYHMPWSQETLCGGASPCGNLSCRLSSGWLNLGSGFSDDADWFVHQAATPSSGTGPTTDAGGTTAGKYLYTEASGCSDKTSVLWSPMFQPDGKDTAWVRFHYHMWGTNMGNVEVATVTSRAYTPHFQVQGNQGNQWLTAQFPVVMQGESSVFFRLKAQNGPGFLSDIAVDDFVVDTLPIDLQPSSGTALCQWTPGTLQRVRGAVTDQWFFSFNGLDWQATGAGPHLIPSGTSGVLTGHVRIEGQAQHRFYFRYPIVGAPQAAFSWLAENQGYIQFQGTEQDGATWFWNFGDGQFAQGRTPRHAYAQNGNYQVKLRVENACGQDSSQQEVVVVNVGIEPTAPIPGWQVFPNPFSKDFSVVHPFDIDLDTWELYDVSGRLLREGVFHGDESRVEVGEISEGVYYFRVLSSAGSLIFRIIKRS